MWLITYLEKIYKANEKTRAASRTRIFHRCSFFMEFAIKYGTILYFLSVLSYYAFALYMYVYEHEFVTLLPNYIPGIDYKTKYGYAIYFAYHSISIFFGFIGTSACDFFFVMITFNTPLLAALISEDIAELNDLLAAPRQDSQRIKYHLRNILMMHREMTMQDEISIKRVHGDVISLFLLQFHRTHAKGIFQGLLCSNHKCQRCLGLCSAHHYDG